MQIIFHHSEDANGFLVEIQIRSQFSKFFLSIKASDYALQKLQCVRLCLVEKQSPSCGQVHTHAFMFDSFARLGLGSFVLICVASLVLSDSHLFISCNFVCVSCLHLTHLVTCCAKKKETNGKLQLDMCALDHMYRPCTIVEAMRKRAVHF